MKSLLFILAGIMFLLTSCYKSETVYYDQLDVTLTQYDTKFDFSSYTSFSMPDSTILKTNYLEESEIEEFYAIGGTSEKTLDILKEQFIARGYSYTSDRNTADFIASPTILMIKQTGAVYYPPGWWWGYPGYGWGGWPGWGYPGYPWNPGYVSYYSYKEGTIALEMIDGDSFRNIENWVEQPTNDVPDLVIRWLASIDGYISSNGDYNAERAQRGVDEAFKQSPYLKK